MIVYHLEYDSDVHRTLKVNVNYSAELPGNRIAAGRCNYWHLLRFNTFLGLNESNSYLDDALMVIDIIDGGKK